MWKTQFINYGNFTNNSSGGGGCLNFKWRHLCQSDSTPHYSVMQAPPNGSRNVLLSRNSTVVLKFYGFGDRHKFKKIYILRRIALYKIKTLL